MLFWKRTVVVKEVGLVRKVVVVVVAIGVMEEVVRVVEAERESEVKPSMVSTFF